MTYAATWTNSNAQRRLQGGVHWIRACDMQELADAINRRRQLTYQSPDTFSLTFGAGNYVSGEPIDGPASPACHSFRENLWAEVLRPPVEIIAGEPRTPTAMDWLWPLAGGDEGKVIVACDPAPGQVGLFAMLNGTDNYTDPALGGPMPVRAVHVNELRQCVEWLSRGRWVLPIYFSGGLFSTLPDTPWTGGMIAHNGSAQLRTVGFAILRVGQPVLGLVNVTPRPSSYMEVWSDKACTAEVYHCLRTIDFTNDRPDWNQFAPIAGQAWATAGGIGGDDSTLIGTIDLTGTGSTRLDGEAMAEALKAMTDGAASNLLLRRTDQDSQTVSVWGQLVVEFDLDSPPN